MTFNIKMKGLKQKFVLTFALAIGIAFFFGNPVGHAKLAAAACSDTPNSSLGTDSMSVTIPSTGTYYVWTRMLDPDTTNNSIYMQVDGGCAVNVGDSSSIPANTWTWVDYLSGNTGTVNSMSLTAGTHTVLLTGEGSGVGIDSILFLGDQTCVPTGTGTNCTSPTYDPPTISITAPTSGATVGGTSVPLSATANDDDDTISSVVFKVDGTTVDTDTAYPYTYNWSSTGATDGSHTLTATATNADGQSTTATESFTVANHTCASAPSAPGGVTATATGLMTMSVSWSASTASSGCSVTGYQIYRAGTEIGTSTSTTYADSGLTPDTAYQYYVKAIDNDSHTSAASSTVTGTTQADTTAPSAPTNVAATALNSASVKLTWTASTDNVAVAGYRIYRNSVLYTTVNGASTVTYTDNDATADTSYVYAVSAIDTSSNESAHTTATPDPVKTPAAADTTPPTQPTGLHSVLSTSSAITIQWTASTDNVAVAGYHVYRGSTEVGSVTSGTSYTDTGLSSSTTYQYHVIAYDTSANLSTASSTIGVETQAGTIVSNNGDLNADGTVNFLDLSILLSHWGSTSATASQGDINSDGVVNFLDLSIMLSHWGQ
jgi:chitodextrinase